MSALAQKGSDTHCDPCPDVESVLNPTGAWQTIAGSTANASNGDYSYQFCAIADGGYGFSFCQQGGTADFDTGLSIWTLQGAACGGTTPIACVDDFCGLLSELIWIAPADGMYVLRVGGFGGATGDYVLAYYGRTCGATAVESTTWGAIKSMYE
jgi:hypothetical protein